MSRRINIQETVDSNILTELNINSIQESAKSTNGLPDKIITVVEGIHSGITRNNTFYPSGNLEKSVESWTKPFNKPVIKNHNTYEEPVGRVISAKFKESNIAPDKHTIELELEITDSETIKKVLDGRYRTLSIGGSTNSVVCSVCGKDLVNEGYCGHMKGRTYEGKKAHWIIGEMDFDEISWVNVPADVNAQVVNKNATKQTESVNAEEGGMAMPTQESQDILDQIDNLMESNAPGENPGQQAENQDEQPPQAPEAQAEGTEDGAEGNEQQPTLEEQLASALAKVQKLEADAVELIAEKDAAEEKLQTAESARDTLQTEVTRLTDELQVADDENKGLVKQNITLASYAHKVLAESVVNAHVLLGKVEESAVEEKMTEMTKLTSRALKEELTTLLADKPQRIIQTVDNPASELIAESATPKTEEPKPLTIADLAESFNKAFNKSFN